MAAPVLYVYLKGGEDSISSWITEGMADPVPRREKMNAHLVLVCRVADTRLDPVLFGSQLALPRVFTLLIAPPFPPIFDRVCMFAVRGERQAHRRTWPAPVPLRPTVRLSPSLPPPAPRPPPPARVAI